MTWQIPITDRTLSDVELVIQVSTKILNSGYSSLSVSELSFWEDSPKGTLNHSDLNRIEGNCIFLKELFLSRGYSCEIVTRSTEWIESDFPTMSEVDRIKQNVLNIAEILNVVTNITLGTEYLNYINVNNIELGVYTTNVLLELMSSYFRKSGTFKSGQGVILP